MNVLFVDDDVDDREFFMDAMSYVDSSIRCVLAKNCNEALTYLETASDLPSFVFLDIHMPAMDGKTCLKRIKNNPRYSSIKVVMYSGSSDQDLMEEYKALGATYFLIKPATFKGLCDTLSVMLDTPQ